MFISSKFICSKMLRSRLGSNFWNCCEAAWRPAPAALSPEEAAPGEGCDEEGAESGLLALLVGVACLLWLAFASWPYFPSSEAFACSSCLLSASVFFAGEPFDCCAASLLWPSTLRFYSICCWASFALDVLLFWAGAALSCWLAASFWGGGENSPRRAADELEDGVLGPTSRIMLSPALSLAPSCAVAPLRLLPLLTCSCRSYCCFC